ncbi:MAG: hypothetical protein V3T86_03675 [Planctomycetota bacterium]
MFKRDQVGRGAGRRRDDSIGAPIGMLCGMLLLTLAVSAAAQNSTAIKELNDALRVGDDHLQLDMLEKHGGNTDPAVMRVITKYLRAKSTAVRDAAIRLYGSSQSPAALKALHSLYRSDRKLRKNDELFATLLREIGRHGDRGSVKILGDINFKYLTLDTGVARLAGLSNIRSIDSVEVLMRAAKKGRSKGIPKQLRGQFAEPWRMAMAVLTGQDFGVVREDWEAWWRSNKKTFNVSQDRPKVAEDVSQGWERYWKTPYYVGGPISAEPKLGPPFTRVESPSNGQVEEAVDAIAAAFKSKDEGAKIEAIETYAGLIDSRVVRAMARGLRDRSERIQIQTADMLGWQKHPEGLKQLHRFFRRKSDIHKHERIYAHTLKAIGRHGDESSIQVLAKSPFKGLTLASGEARIYGIGNIRHKDAVEALIKGMRLAGEGRRRRGWNSDSNRFLAAFRVNLASLTGADEGLSREGWQHWYRKNKKDIAVARQRAEMKAELKAMWEEYWNEAY